MLSAVLDCCLWVSSYRSSTSDNLFTDFNRCLLSSKTCWRYLVISKHSWVVCGFLPPMFGNTPSHLTRTILLKLGEHEKYYQKTGGIITSRSAYDHKFYWNDVVKIGYQANDSDSQSNNWETGSLITSWPHQFLVGLVNKAIYLVTKLR